MSLEAKITKLEALLTQVQKGTPTYTTIAQQLNELLKERDKVTAATDKQPSEEKPNERPVNDSMFQAIGVIKGAIATDIVLNEEGEERTLYSVVIQDKKYRLRILGYRFRFFIKQVQNNPDKQLYFLVYPYLQFIPKNQPELRFQVVSWQDLPYENFKVNEFNIRGIWQFIPQYRRPLISVQRNWMDKESRNELLEKGQDFKAVHVPVLWKDSPVPPFRFNPRADKQGAAKGSGQPDRFFVEFKAKFIPKLDTFGFTELLAEPTTIFPRYLLPKAKMEKLAEKRKTREGKQGN